MRNSLIVGGGVVLLIAALTACSDSLSTGEDNPLSDTRGFIVHGTTYLENIVPPYQPQWIAHGANVGLRLMEDDPGDYIYEDISDEQTGYYEFNLIDLDYDWYVVDAWYENATTEWFGTSWYFHWDGELYPAFSRNVYMLKQ
jgi:hypothetical protein